MTAQAPSDLPSRRGPSLNLKLLLLVGGALLLVEIPALLLLLPQIRRQFQERTLDLILISQEGMNEIAEQLVRTNEDVVIEVASHISDTYRRELADLPLALARGDESKIKSLILGEVSALRGRALENIEFLGEELRRRSEGEVTDRMDALREVQRKTGRRFLRSIQSESAIVAAILILAPLPVLLLGLFRMVLRPLTRLADATARARGGDLAFSVEVSSRDEIGLLQDSFNRMIHDLARSREEIESWSATLEARVEEKTAELRAALAEQRATTQRLEAILAQLRETQSRLIHAEKMASVGQLARSVAHEFNNLLGGILGSAGAALDENPGGSSAEALEVIRRAARRACVITDNLLGFGRRQETVKRPCRLDRIAGECLDLVEPELRRRDVRVERDFGPLPEVPADAGQIHQVLLNLLANAGAAVRQGGRIRVSLRQSGRTAEIGVADDGPGVPEAIRERIFEPFVTARESGEAGTGLGLAVSYGIVREHGGSIDLRDNPEGGALFVVSLPLDEPEASHGE